MVNLHWQGGPGPAHSTWDDNQLSGTMTRLGEKWEYAGFRSVSGNTIDPDMFLFKHVALLESRVRFIQRGH